MQDTIQAARPGWRRFIDFPLVSMVLAFAAIVLAGALGSRIIQSLPMREGLLLTAFKAVISVALVVLVYKLFVVRLGERPRDDLVANRAGLRDLGIGIAAGGLLFAAVAAVAGLFGVFRVTGWGDPQAFLLAIFTLGLVPAVNEEILARGVLFRFLEEFGGTWSALVLTSLLFGMAHFFNPGASLLSSLAIALEAGVLLGGAYMLTRNLWLAIGLHGGWNVTQGGVFAVPVSGFQSKGLLTSELNGNPLLSGGGFGLEASLIAVLLVTAAGLWMVWRAVQAGRLAGPFWTERRRAREASAETL